jgi:hypothetical protein
VKLYSSPLAHASARYLPNTKHKELIRTGLPDAVVTRLVTAQMSACMLHMQHQRLEVRQGKVLARCEISRCCSRLLQDAPDAELKLDEASEDKELYNNVTCSNMSPQHLTCWKL